MSSPKKYIEIYPIATPSIFVKRFNITNRSQRFVEKVERKITINTNLHLNNYRVVEVVGVNKKIISD